MKLHIALGLLLFSWLTLGGLSSCKKKTQFGNGNLDFSTDTLVFDTVFTTIGSTTLSFKIYNNQNKALKIEEIQLMGGSNSPFKINFDGIQGPTVTDQEIARKDSLYCFVEVKLQVNGQVLPMVVEDSIRFRTNGEDQFVKLAVWGQDMYYHYSNFGTNDLDISEGTWPNDKPHVIYGAAFVDSAKTLNIIGGTQIYLHKNSILWNYKGTLNIDGDYNNKVVIRGDRLESEYQDASGQYYGVYYQEARPSIVDNVIIRNATAGIHVDSRDQNFSQNTITMSNLEIYNASSYGIFLYNDPHVYGENVLVHSNGVHSLLVIQGAEFQFNHCDFLGYGDAEGSTPAVGISNYYVNSSGVGFVANINGQFNNCVIYGSSDEQLAFDTIQQGNTVIQFNFRNCVIQRTDLTNGMFANCNANNPFFNNPGNDDFKFTNTSSSLNNNGNPLYTTQSGLDLLGVPRSTPPDIGVYEN